MNCLNGIIKQFNSQSKPIHDEVKSLLITLYIKNLPLFYEEDFCFYMYFKVSIISSITGTSGRKS